MILRPLPPLHLVHTPKANRLHVFDNGVILIQGWCDHSILVHTPIMVIDNRVRGVYLGRRYENGNLCHSCSKPNMFDPDVVILHDS